MASFSSSGGAPKAKQGAARVTVLKAPLVGYFDTQNEHWEGYHTYNDSTLMTSAPALAEPWDSFEGMYQYHPYSRIY